MSAEIKKSKCGETMKNFYLPIIALILLTTSLSAQDRLPKDYTSPDEIITLSADMTFDQAFDILSRIAYEKEGKTIIDPAKRKGRIDVSIVNLPWKSAFEVILKAHRLSYIEHEQFYEVTGQAAQLNPEEMKISLTSREVLIEAIFFEADKSALAESGIDWEAIVSSGSVTGSFAVNGASAVSDEIVEGNAVYGTSKNDVDYDIAGMLRAFDSKNLGRILAQPQIIVVSGKQGKIQVGQDFSIKTRDFAGNVIDNFFSTGTILEVKPVVYTEDNIPFIHLTIHAERSSAQPDPVSTTINKSLASTEALMVDGETTTLGGLYAREFTTIRKGVPYLKDLPWWFLGLRYVFGYNLKDVSDKELLVVLKASLLPDLRTRHNTKKSKPMGEEFDINRQKQQSDLDNNWDQGVESHEKLE